MRLQPNVPAHAIARVRRWGLRVALVHALGLVTCLGQIPICVESTTLDGNEVSLVVTAANDSWLGIQASPDLVNWENVATRQVQLANRATIGLIVSDGTARQFFRVESPPAIRLAPAGAALLTGATQTFSAVTSVPGTVTWSVVEPGGGSVTPAGVYTAPPIAGTYHVRAITARNPAASVEAEINVVAVSAAELSRFNDAAAYSDGVQGDALLVMKQGAIVFEHYANLGGPDNAHLLASGTKSFNAAIFALGEAEGIWTLDENVSQTITEWIGVPNKSAITIRHLLSLSSGLVDSPLYSPTNVENLDTYDLAINGTSTPYPPGVACIYGSSNFQVFAALLERKTGLDPVQFLFDRLLSRLGFTASQAALWTRDLRGHPQMAGGAYFNARSWLNFGRLWTQQGVFDGQPLLNPTTTNLAVTYGNPTFTGYGLSWWLNLPTGNTYTPGVDSLPPAGHGDGQQIATTAPMDTYMAAGTGNQRLYVIPSLDLVIVRFGHGLGNSFTDHTMLGKLLGTLSAESTDDGRRSTASKR
ncbi:hypothetical protein AYO41_05040 [Verrucomicrobia bacterium SCGC AG-212-E04]|nr:hypothetical protein AYO41_05040 [Verrucomicrobia bacterium SCGC AG-212-E04]